MAQLISKPGISNNTVLSIPATWDPTWFRSFVNNQLTGADVRNATGSGGIVVSGTIASPYATIGFAAPITLPGPVTITQPASNTAVALTVNAVDSSSTPGLAVEAPSGATKGTYIQIGTSGGLSVGWIGMGTAVFGPSGTYGDLWIAAASATSNMVFAIGSSPAERMLIAHTGGITINPSNNIGSGGDHALQVNGANNSYTALIQGSTTASSFGLLISAGTGSSSEAALLINNAANTLNLFEVSGNSQTFLFNISTTATAANVNVATSGTQQILRSTSSLRYKTNVQSIQGSDINAVLQMRPVTFNSTCAADDPTVTHLGFIAEEMALIDPRLVTYAPAVQQLQNKVVQGVSGSAMVPESVQYDRVVTLLVGAVQTLVQRIAALEQAASSSASAPTPSPSQAAPVAPQLTLTGSYGLTGTNVVSTPSVVTVLPPANPAPTQGE